MPIVLPEIEEVLTFSVALVDLLRVLDGLSTEID